PKITTIHSTISIPILGEIACGNPITAVENISGYVEEPSDNLPSGTLFYLKAKGHSMEPTIPDNSNVLIREQPNVEDGEIAAVLVNGDTEATLKRVKHQGNLVILMPDNQAYNPFIVTPDNPARVLGKAIRYTTDL
ncbi:MAG: S24 family peptidase, partial [Bacillota bacterium]|nr:S24 family peptidase [Bacillota bacterium]